MASRMTVRGGRGARDNPGPGCWAGILICLMLLQAAAEGQQPAFPGAEGFGRNARGGRGGRVIYVTNLNDAGPGSLRAACSARGPRTVLFQVSGVIRLDTLLTITEPYLTIAGQTAPGEGICLARYGCVLERTHDVIMRHLRLRPGDGARAEQDALWIHESRDVIIDHCSASWGTDETVSITGGGTTNVTVQWCMITESLNRSVHHKGPHGYGSLLRVDGDLSVHHNLYAHHASRNPRPGCYGDMERGSLLDFRNNVIYDWGERAGYTAEDKASINYVGNYLRPGPSTGKGMRTYAFYVGGAATRLFVDRNLHEKGAAGGDPWAVVKLQDRAWSGSVRLDRPLAVAPVQTDSPERAFARVLDSAGAMLPRRDPVDARVVEEVRQGKGRIIDTQNDVGGWSAYQSALPQEDRDGDGMPDAWEGLHGTDPGKADGQGDPDSDGYTDLEEYLNSTDPRGGDVQPGQEGRAADGMKSAGAGKTVLLDCFFNSEWRKSRTGTPERYHYVWHDTTNSGFSILGKIIAKTGAALDTLCRRPTAERLRRADVYLLVDPDTPRETEVPEYIDPASIREIEAWVGAGGVLLLFGNDKGNAEFEHLNLLAGRFGVHFNEDSRNRVTGKEYQTGAFDRFPGHPLFAGVRRIFMKEVSTLRLSDSAGVLLQDGEDVIIALTRYGRGLVFAVGDPWFYDEYMDGRRLPEGYDNSRAAENLFRWLLAQTGTVR